MLQDKVSIIIVTYNAGEKIEAAIESVARQHYPHKELIIIDGGSTDRTISTLVALQNEISYWKSEPDKGIYDAMNKGVKVATGHWLLFLGADDKLSPGILDTLFTGNQHAGIDLLYGKVNLDGSAKTMGEETDADKLIEYNIPHQAVFYRKTVLEEFKGYDLTYKILADYDLAIRIFETPRLQKKFIDKEFSFFNSRGVSNRIIDEAFFIDKLAHFIQHRGLSKTDNKLGKYYFFIGVTQMLKKQYGKGLRNMMHPLIYSNQRFYYFMVTCSVFLTFMGIGRPYKYAPRPI